VHKAVLEDGFGDFAGPLGDAVQGHELSLHVGGKARVFGGAKALCFQTPLAADADKALARLDLGTSGLQFLDHRLEMVGTRVAQHHVATGGRNGAQKGTGLDAVGHHPVFRLFGLDFNLDIVKQKENMKRKEQKKNNTKKKKYKKKNIKERKKNTYKKKPNKD